MTPVADIIKSIRRVVGPGQIGLHDPSVDIHERASVINYMIKDPVGYDAINEFQDRIAKVCGTEQALCVNSGTSALHLALLVSGVTPYSEVFVPALTFIATANAVSYCGAIPHFVDVRGWDYGINPFKLQRYMARICDKRAEGTFNKLTGRRIAGIVAVDLLGVPCDMDAINAEGHRWGLPVIEDAAEALGSRYKGRPCGSNGNIGILSFNNNKIVTTNGGGALLTNDAWVQAKAWELGTTARMGHPWRMGDHSCIAYNYRMGNINAALGLPQLKRLDELVKYKTLLHEAYISEGLAVKLEGELAPIRECNYWLNAFNAVAARSQARRDM